MSIYKFHFLFQNRERIESFKFLQNYMIFLNKIIYLFFYQVVDHNFLNYMKIWSSFVFMKLQFAN